MIVLAVTVLSYDPFAGGKRRVIVLTTLEVPDPRAAPGW